MKKFIELIKKVDKGTLIRTIALIVTALNDVAVVIASICGAHSTAYIVISIVATVGAALVAGWENNDWTDAARLGTAVLDALEDGKITTEEVEKLLNKETKKPAAGGRDKKDELK